MADVIDTELLLDDVDSPIIMQDECAELKPILQDFVQAYTENSDKPVSEWLSVKLQEHLPEALLFLGTAVLLLVQKIRTGC